MQRLNLNNEVPFCFQSECQHLLHMMSDHLFLQGLNLHIHSKKCQTLFNNITDTSVLQFTLCMLFILTHGYVQAAGGYTTF